MSSSRTVSFTSSTPSSCPTKCFPPAILQAPHYEAPLFSSHTKDISICSLYPSRFPSQHAITNPACATHFNPNSGSPTLSTPSSPSLQIRKISHASCLPGRRPASKRSPSHRLRLSLHPNTATLPPAQAQNSQSASVPFPTHPYESSGAPKYPSSFGTTTSATNNSAAPSHTGTTAITSSHKREQKIPTHRSQALYFTTKSNMSRRSES